MLQNEHLLARLGFDTAENEPSKFWQFYLQTFANIKHLPDFANLPSWRSPAVLRRCFRRSGARDSRELYEDPAPVKKRWTRARPHRRNSEFAYYYSEDGSVDCPPEGCAQSSKRWTLPSLDKMVTSIWTSFSKSSLATAALMRPSSSACCMQPICKTLTFMFCTLSP